MASTLKKIDVGYSVMIDCDKNTEDDHVKEVYEVLSWKKDMAVIMGYNGQIIDIHPRSIREAVVSRNRFHFTKRMFAERLMELFLSSMCDRDFSKVVNGLSEDFYESFCKEIAEHKRDKTYGTAKTVLSGVFNSLSSAYAGFMVNNDRWSKLFKKAKKTVRIR